MCALLSTHGLLADVFIILQAIIFCGQHTPSAGLCSLEENASSGLSSILILE